MRMKIMMLLAVLFVGVQTANAGQKPDIQEVVSVSVDPLACGIADAVMTYKDSHGMQKTYTYKTWTYNCTQQQ
jgi:hypothetical protein